MQVTIVVGGKHIKVWRTQIGRSFYFMDDGCNMWHQGHYNDIDIVSIDDQSTRQLLWDRFNRLGIQVSYTSENNI